MGKPENDYMLLACVMIIDQYKSSHSVFFNVTVGPMKDVGHMLASLSEAILGSNGSLAVSLERRDSQEVYQQAIIATSLLNEMVKLLLMLIKTSN